MDTLQIGGIRVTWLKGGRSNLDGGAMFGVVPKPLWSRKYEYNEKNQIPLRTDPLLLQTKNKNILIDAGIGNDKMNEKTKRNQGVTEESSVVDSLWQLGLTPADIHIVLMTHLHFDHASGLTKKENEQFTSVFPNALIYVSDIEWNEMRSPNIRSRNTYWRENWEPIAQQVQIFQKEAIITEQVRVVHTGGHSDGHAIVIVEDGGETLLHMGDLLPTHAHQNVLWVMAYDDYPMTSIAQKQQWITYGIEKHAWFTFYHDYYYRAIKWDREGMSVQRIEVSENKKSL